MIGARVNGNIVPFDHSLETGDRVEIVTSRNSSGPKHEWLSIVKSSTARGKINQWFRAQNKDENVIKGKELLEKEATRKGFSFGELLGSDAKQEAVLRRYNFNNIDQLYASVGHGGIKEGQIITRFVNEHNKDNERKLRQDLINMTVDERIVAQNMQIDSSETKNKSSKSGIVVQGIGDLSVRFSKCCSPVPGDEIVAFVTRGRGVSVHRTDCNNIVHLPSLERARLIEAAWDVADGAQGMSFRADLNIICEDRVGLVLDISKILGDNNVPVKEMNARSLNNEAVFNIGIEISSRDHLDRICQKIMAVPGVAEIRRLS